MKLIKNKDEFPTLLIRNSSGQPKIALIMPITRSGSSSESKWRAALSFVESSKIEFLVIIDKTNDGSATNFFMEHFTLSDRTLYIVPRSITESHYESLGSIQLEENIWTMQLHDDDDWEGSVALPNPIDPCTAYYSRFFIKNQSNNFIEEDDFLYPARINFVLIPFHIWNKFAQMIQDQKFHVAGSMDSTLNTMVQVTCKFVAISDFLYFYDNHNWANRAAARRSLLKLTEIDGWGIWATVDIALFSRLLDNLSSLNYVTEFAEADSIDQAFQSLMQRFKPRLRRRMIIRLEILFLRLKSMALLPSLESFIGADLVKNTKSKLSTALFIRNSWDTQQLTEVVDLIKQLEQIDSLEKLHKRFYFWRITLLNLRDKIEV